MAGAGVGAGAGDRTGTETAADWTAAASSAPNSQSKGVEGRAGVGIEAGEEAVAGVEDDWGPGGDFNSSPQTYALIPRPYTLDHRPYTLDPRPLTL